MAKALLLLGIAASGLVAACGGKAVFDGSPGAGGAGGAGTGTTTGVVVSSGPGPGSSSVVGPGSSSVGPSTSVSGPGSVTAVSAVSSTSTGPTCDNTGDCGYCQNCALDGPCADAWNQCLSNDACYGLLDCFQNCSDDACYDECQQKFQDGLDDYYALVVCVICDECYSDCDGGGSGC